MLGRVMGLRGGIWKDEQGYLHGPHLAHPGMYNPEQSYSQLVAVYCFVDPVFSLNRLATTLLEIPAATQHSLLFNVSD